jgi:hypothetical protein
MKNEIKFLRRQAQMFESFADALADIDSEKSADVGLDDAENDENDNDDEDSD